MANKAPRSYQVFNDLIGSKQSTEPIALSIGTGPIVGFDIMDTTKNYFAITGRSRENFTNDQVKAWQKEMGSTPYTRISTKENQAENIVNAYTTPDGLIHVAPALIEFPQVPIDYSLRNTPGQVQCVAVKVKHTYLDQATTVPIPPSSIDFTAVKLNGFVPNMTVSTDVGILYNSTYPELLSILSNYGFTLDPNTEAFVGLYVIGITEGLDDQHVAYYREKDNLTSLVMYGGKWPKIVPQNVRDRMLDYINYHYLAGEVLQLNADIERLLDTVIPNFEDRINRQINDISNEVGQKLQVGPGGATLFFLRCRLTASGDPTNPADWSLNVEMRDEECLNKGLINPNYTIRNVIQTEPNNTDLIPWHRPSGYQFVRAWFKLRFASNIFSRIKILSLLTMDRSIAGTPGEAFSGTYIPLTQACSTWVVGTDLDITTPIQLVSTSGTVVSFSEVVDIVGVLLDTNTQNTETIPVSGSVIEA